MVEIPEMMKANPRLEIILWATPTGSSPTHRTITMPANKKINVDKKRKTLPFVMVASL